MSVTNKPLVTVFTLVYHTNPQFVIEAINSVFSQTYSNIEHIIVNDAPDDKDCWPIIKKYVIEKNFPSLIIEHDVSYGIPKTLNQIISIANGKYLLGCSDDILLPNRIKDDVEVFEKLNDDYAIVFSMSQVIDENSNLQLYVLPHLRSLPSEKQYFRTLIKGNFISAPAVTARIDALKKVGGYDEEIKYEDYDMWLKLSYKGYKFEAIPIINTYYRVHNEGFSKIINAKFEDFKSLIKYIHLEEVKKILEERLINYGLNNRKLYQQLIALLNNKSKPNIKVIAAGLNIPKYLKIILLYILKQTF